MAWSFGLKFLLNDPSQMSRLGHLDHTPTGPRLLSIKGNHVLSRLRDVMCVVSELGAGETQL